MSVFTTTDEFSSIPGADDWQADRRSYSLPFYEIEIGESVSDLVLLPPELARLIEKVEIQQVGEDCSLTQATITFIEGSREPLNINTSGKDPLFTTSGFSNQQGFLGDLYLSDISELGFSNLINYSAQNLTSNLAPVSSFVNVNLDPDFSSVNSESVSTPHFLFHQDNVVRITWGYKQIDAVMSDDATNSFTGRIIMAQYDFPENEQPKMVVTINTISARFSQITPVKAIRFSAAVPAGVDESGVVLSDYKEMEISDVVAQILDELDVDYVVSKGISGQTLGKLGSKVWSSNMSLDQFFHYLARRYNCVYTINYDPVADKHTVLFLTYADFYKEAVIPEFLTIWKGQYSILKSVAIRCDWGSLTGGSVKGVDSKGKLKTFAAETTLPLAVGPKDKKVSTKSDDPIVKQALKTFSNNTQISKTEVSPSTNAEHNSYTAQAMNHCTEKRLVVLEAETLGHPKLHPGAIHITGIGARFSAYYKIITVIHTLSSSGYVCKFTAQSEALASGSIDPTGATKISEPKKQDTIIPMAVAGASNPVTDSYEA